MGHRETLLDLCSRARIAARTLRGIDRGPKDRALHVLQERLEAEANIATSDVFKANAIDVEAARTSGLSEALVDRLALDPARVRAIAESVRQIAGMEDPVGAVIGMTRRPNGLLVGQVRIPLGVIAMIYESRPNVTVDAAALCLKSGNSVLLRGGKEARHSNLALGALVRDGLLAAGLPQDSVQLVPAGDRDALQTLVGLAGQIDLVIPRGGEGLIRFVAEHARVPVIQHYKGVCHLFVDAGADIEMALRLIENGKLQRPGVCNALECLLVHADVATALLTKLATLAPDRLEIRGDVLTCSIIASARHANPDDYGREFLAPILAVRIVASMDEALDHIARFGSNHTEAICTRDLARSQRFLREVDASCVLVNASTRFNDGGELGLGAEVGISTTKMHAYGPMGLESLTALKWMVFGEGQTR